MYTRQQMRKIQSGIDLSLILTECAYCEQVLPHTRSEHLVEREHKGNSLFSFGRLEKRKRK